MKSAIVTIAAAAGSAAAQQSAYGQCGGINWTGPTDCVSGYTCTSQNPYYYQCTYGASSATAAAVASTKVSTALATTIVATTTVAKPASSSLVASSHAASPLSTSRATSAVAASVASSTKAATTATTLAASSSKVVVSSVASSSKAVVSSATSVAKPASSSAATSASAAAPAASGKTKYAGINISGFDFGCGTDGTCTVSGVDNPGTTGQDQMNHFVSETGLNAFRLPVAWQYLTNAVLGATLDATNLAAYDTLVQNCLGAGAELCIVDIHNYARWDGNIIGQSNGAVTNAQFTSLWSQLANKYASSPKVAFGIMNEPHDLTSVPEWATTVQAAVTAIRNAGATSNMILLPGNDYTHASSTLTDGSYTALKNITNLDGSTTNLVFDVHQYLDSDDSGTSSTCTTNNVATFTTLAAQLRTDGRQAMLTETGGGPTDPTCLSMVCQELTYLAQNADVYLGWTGWAAGEFATSYVLSETPNGSPGSYVDQPLVTQCIAGAFVNTTLSA